MAALKFPKNFIWGTSTAAYQIETAFEHDWKGVVAKDASVFNRTADHEKHFETDADLILNCASAYRMSMQWSKLQRMPYADFHQETVNEYKAFLDKLKIKGCHIMIVLHHFTDPLWFVKKAKWTQQEHIEMFLDYVTKMRDTFGDYADSWNTFNEPNVYVSNGWITGLFPPFKHNLFQAFRVIKNLGIAHESAYKILKEKSIAPVGISHNAVCFVGEHWLGEPFAKLADWWFMKYCMVQFKSIDFFGMSYYAKIPFVPYPINFADHPEKFKKGNRPHDDMWEYYPKGMSENIMRYWNLYKKPIIITESGICTPDDQVRMNALSDYLMQIHNCIQQGVDIKGFFCWSTFDNFEWNLGRAYRFGLYRTDFETMKRKHTASVDFYKKVSSTNTLVVPN